MEQMREGRERNRGNGKPGTSLCSRSPSIGAIIRHQSQMRKQSGIHAWAEHCNQDLREQEELCPGFSGVSGVQVLTNSIFCGWSVL